MFDVRVLGAVALLAMPGLTGAAQGGYESGFAGSGSAAEKPVTDLSGDAFSGVDSMTRFERVYEPRPVLPSPALSMAPEALAAAPADRIGALVPEHLLPYFDLYLYVNKATRGIWAQQMFVYERDASLDQPQFDMMYRWRVSTGREKMERHFTTTPTGLFQLDPERFNPAAVSNRWDGAAMSWAMFFDYSYTTRKSGYAIHAAIPDDDINLGRRASAGCIRVYLPYAEKLFKLVRGSYAGMVPKFAFDTDGSGTTFRDGTLELDEKGEPVMKKGYRVLVVVDDKVMKAPKE